MYPQIPPPRPTATQWPPPKPKRTTARTIGYTTAGIIAGIIALGIIGNAIGPDPNPGPSTRIAAPTPTQPAPVAATQPPPKPEPEPAATTIEDTNTVRVLIGQDWAAWMAAEAWDTLTESDHDDLCDGWLLFNKSAMLDLATSEMVDLSVDDLAELRTAMGFLFNQECGR